MKKSLKGLIIVTVVLMISMLSSCALLNELFNKMRGPVDQWLNYELPFSYKGTKITLDTYITYTLDGATYKNLKDGYDLKTEGLSILIIPDLEADKVEEKSEEEKNAYLEACKDVFGDEINGSYIYKKWNVGDELIYNKENGEKTVSVKMDRSKWDILYAATKFGAGIEADDEDAGLPFVLSSKVSAYKEFELSGDIWKKVLAAIILNKL